MTKRQLAIDATLWLIRAGVKLVGVAVLSGLAWHLMKTSGIIFPEFFSGILFVFLFLVSFVDYAPETVVRTEDPEQLKFIQDLNINIRRREDN